MGHVDDVVRIQRIVKKEMDPFVAFVPFVVRSSLIAYSIFLCAALSIAGSSPDGP